MHVMIAFAYYRPNVGILVTLTLRVFNRLGGIFHCILNISKLHRRSFGGNLLNKLHEIIEMTSHHHLEKMEARPKGVYPRNNFIDIERLYQSTK